MFHHLEGDDGAVRRERLDGLSAEPGKRVLRLVPGIDLELPGVERRTDFRLGDTYGPRAESVFIPPGLLEVHVDFARLRVLLAIEGEHAHLRGLTRVTRAVAVPVVLTRVRRTRAVVVAVADAVAVRVGGRMTTAETAAELACDPLDGSGSTSAGAALSFRDDFHIALAERFRIDTLCILRTLGLYTLPREGIADLVPTALSVAEATTAEISATGGFLLFVAVGVIRTLGLAASVGRWVAFRAFWTILVRLACATYQLRALRARNFDAGRAHFGE